MNNYEGWHHIGTAPKDREILVWDGSRRHIAHWDRTINNWTIDGFMPLHNLTHWRGCPPPPPIALPDDED